MDEILHTLQNIFLYLYKLISITRKSLYSISTLTVISSWLYILSQISFATILTNIFKIGHQHTE